MKAFSFEWPYVSFSGIINNHVFLLNAYDKTIIHRIQIAEDQQNAHFKCLATVVTTTKDLFILTLKNDLYQILKYDLDESNQSEHGDSSNKMFKQMLVMEYHKKDVGLGEFKNMICRGNSSKEKIDTNHKLLIFLHHGNNLY